MKGELTEEKDYVIDGEESDETFSYGEIMASDYGFGYKIHTYVLRKMYSKEDVPMYLRKTYICILMKILYWSILTTRT